MQLRLVRYLLCLFFLCNIPLKALENPYATNSILYQIESDYMVGNITLDDKVILQINSIKHIGKLPIKYSSNTHLITNSELREVTIALIQIRSIWEELNQKTKLYFTTAFARASTTFSYVSPDGYYRLHFDTTGVNAVSSEDLDLDSIPDFIERCAAYCDSTLAKHLALGYMYPPNDGVVGGDSLYDIYFEEMSSYGYAVPEGIGSNPWNDFYSYIVLNNDFIGFPSNNDPEGIVVGAAKVTIAHEFHHAVQFGYDANEDLWAYESGATSFEEVVFEQVNDNYNYLDDFLDFPHTSLMANGGLHKYGAFIWPLYLAQNFDSLINLSAWEAARFDDLFVAYADTLLNKFGWEIDSAYVDFTYWMFNTSLADDGMHFSEGSAYNPLTVSGSHISYPVTTTNSPVSIGGYGAGYLTFFPGTEIGKLKVTFNGSNTRDWKAYVIKSTTQNSHEIEFIELDPISKLGEIIVENFENYYSVTLVGVNTDEFSSGVLFTYAAEIIQPFEVSTMIQSPVDSAIYSGGSRTFDILVRNDAVVNDIYRIIYWDVQGWLPIDTFDLAIAAGDSAVVPIVVSPPQGTQLNELSLMTFRTESWGDSTVFDVQTRTGKIYLFYGDVDFSGTIDISDIVALVSYSFNNGPLPQPVLLSADFDCSNFVDISDVVTLVSYMFSNGVYPPCNPY